MMLVPMLPMLPMLPLNVTHLEHVTSIDVLFLRRKLKVHLVGLYGDYGHQNPY